MFRYILYILFSVVFPWYYAMAFSLMPFTFEHIAMLFRFWLLSCQNKCYYVSTPPPPRCFIWKAKIVLSGQGLYLGLKLGVFYFTLNIARHSEVYGWWPLNAGDEGLRFGSNFLANSLQILAQLISWSKLHLTWVLTTPEKPFSR